MKTYPRPARRHEQAHQAFMIVSHFVANDCKGIMNERGIITYGELAMKMGYPPQTGVTLNTCLGIVARYCEQNGLPYLNAMVVNAETGEPGNEVIWDEALSIKAERKKIRKYEWMALQPPSMKSFRRAVEASK